METKQCTKCLETKPANHENFSPSRNGLAWQSWCRACHREIGRARSSREPRVRTSQNKEYVKGWQQTVKEEFQSGVRKIADGRVCTGCKEYKTKEHFYVHLMTLEGLQPKCKECSAELRKPALVRNLSPIALREKKVAQWAKVLIKSSKSNAIVRGHTWDLPGAEYLQELWEKQSGKCYWYGIDMVPSVENKHPAQPSLERLDNARSYEGGNVVLVCWAANAGRGTTDLETWSTFCQTIRAGLPS